MVVLLIYKITHTLIHTYTHTPTHSYIHSYTHTLIHTHIHTYTGTLIHTYTHTLVQDTESRVKRSLREAETVEDILANFELLITTLSSMKAIVSTLHNLIIA